MLVDHRIEGAVIDGNKWSVWCVSEQKVTSLPEVKYFVDTNN